MKPKESYHEHAATALRTMGVTFTVRYVDNACPPWENNSIVPELRLSDGKHLHGKHYRATFSRKGKRLFIDYWNSLNDANAGLEPVAYDVMAVMTKEDPGTFKQFCWGGYNEDSIFDRNIYVAVSKEWRRVSAFFSENEIEVLQGIN